MLPIRGHRERVELSVWREEDRGAGCENVKRTKKRYGVPTDPQIRVGGEKSVGVHTSKCAVEGTGVVGCTCDDGGGGDVSGDEGWRSGWDPGCARNGRR